MPKFLRCRGMTDTEAIVRDARPGHTVVGWKLDSDERTDLLERFAARYARTVADHGTLAARTARDTPAPADTTGKIIGRTDDGNGIEALVVAIEGSSDRPGGGTYQITWSLEEGRRPRESNDVLAGHGWEPLPEPISIKLKGTRL